MTEVKVDVQDVPDGSEETEDMAMREATHKLFLASVGALAMVQDKMAACLARSIERGEVVEQEGRRLVRQRMEVRKHQVRKLARKQEKIAVDADAEMEVEVEGLLDRMNVPTKSDIDALGAQVTELTKKVDELKGA